jgi:outer membrane protein insertion porin family
VRYFNPFDVKRTTGLGLRIYLPMFGTLGFDYGIGYDKNYGQNNSFGDYLRNNGRFSVILGFEPE